MTPRPVRSVFLVGALLCGCGAGTLSEPGVKTGASSGQAMAITQGMFGVNIDVDNPNGNPSARELAAAGVKVVRFEFRDETAGPLPDPGALARYRSKLAELAAEGIGTIVILDYATLPDFPVQSSDRRRWDAFRARFAVRAGAIAAGLPTGVLAFEVWNEMDEPNNRPEYAPGVPAERYGELLRDTYRAIKAQSRVTVISGGADSGDPNYLVRARRQVGRLFADGVGLHPYGKRPDPGWPTADWGFGDLEDIVEVYHAATGLPVWITEMGTDDDDLAAEYLRRSFARLSGSAGSHVAKVVWFCWTDAMGGAFGLLDAAGVPKPAYHAFRSFVTATVRPPAATAFPDAVVTSVRLEPPDPRAGEQVRFFARVKNQGARGTGQHVGVAYLIDGDYVTWGAEGSLRASEEVDGFASSATWTAREGKLTLTAVADDVDRFQEGDEGNNTLDLAFEVSAETPAPSTPTLRKACFTRFTVPGDAVPSIRVDLEVEVPAWAWTQPMGTSSSSCDFYWPRESFRARFPEVAGAWRVGVDVRGPAAARDGGVDHPWRFGLLSDGCGVSGNEGIPASPGRYTVTGFIKLAPGDESDPARFYAGTVQEGVSWVQDGVDCR